MRQKLNNTPDYIIAAFVGIMALIPRLLGIKANKITFDEAFSYFASKGGITSMIEITSKDVHPPLYYLLLHFWLKIVGGSEISLRLLSIIFSILALIVGYFILRLFFSQSKSLLISIGCVINPFLIYYSWEIRMYSLALLLNLITTYLVIRIKDELWAGNRRKLLIFAIIYGLFASMAFYTHYFSFLIFLSQIFYVVLTGNRQIFIKYYWTYIIMILLPLLIYLPWIKVFASQVLRQQGLEWLPKTELSTIPNVFLDYLSTTSIRNNLALILLPILALAFYLIFKAYRRKYLLFYFMALLPLSVALAISVFRPIFHARYLISASFFLTVLSFIGIFSIKSIYLRRLLFFLLFIVFFAGDVKLFIKPENSYGLVRDQIISNRQTDSIIASPQRSFTYLPLKYYFPDAKCIKEKSYIAGLDRMSNILTGEYNCEYIDKFQGKELWILIKKTQFYDEVKAKNLEVINASIYSDKMLLLVKLKN